MCLFHGCLLSFRYDRDKRHVKNADRTLHELYRATLEKAKQLRAAGYTVVEMWECQWNDQVKHDPVTKGEELDLVHPLNPRDAFSGGRTVAVVFLCKAAADEEIRYVDVTSLYPWVNKNALYPIGHPIIIILPQDQDISNYFGIAFVDILPPEKVISSCFTGERWCQANFPALR